MKTIKAVLLKNWTPCRRVPIGTIIDVPVNLYDSAIKARIIGPVVNKGKTLSQMNAKELESVAAAESIDLSESKDRKQSVVIIEAARKEIVDAKKAGQEKRDAEKAAADKRLADKAAKKARAGQKKASGDKGDGSKDDSAASNDAE